MTIDDLGVDYQWLLELLSDVSIVVASAALILAVINFRNSVQHSRAQLFLQLRANYAEVRAELDKAFEDHATNRAELSFAELDLIQQTAVRNYWTNAFNEWCATVRIYTYGSGTLWKRFYVNAQASSLASRPLREGLLDLMRSPYSFGGMKADYQQVILDLSRRLLQGRAGIEIDASQRAAIQAFLSELDAVKLR